MPFGIYRDWRSSLGYIISPITIPQWEYFKNLELDDVINNICSKEEFINLVDYVYENQFELGNYTKEEITDSYKLFIEDLYKTNKNNPD